MAFVFCNPNPREKVTAIDCTVRAITIATNSDWLTEYIGICVEGAFTANMPSANETWQSYLRRKGFTRGVIPNTCPDCYTVRDFCEDHQQGTYIVGTGSHVIAVIDGDHYDTWDSGDEVPIYYWVKEEH